MSCWGDIESCELGQRSGDAIERCSCRPRRDDGLEFSREWNLELEAAIREDPDDEIAWSILEDWTLERGGVRARVIELEKAGKKDEDVWPVTSEMAGEILGDDDDLRRLGAGFTWRAGYVTKCSVGTTSALRESVLDRVFGLRCIALMRVLQVDVDASDDLECVARRLAGTPVRHLAISAFWKRPTQLATFDPRWLGPTAVLHLMGRAIAVPYGRELERLKTLWLTPGAPSDLRDLFCHANGLPNLAELAVYLSTFEHRHGVRPEPRPLRCGICTRETRVSSSRVH